MEHSRIESKTRVVSIVFNDVAWRMNNASMRYPGAGVVYIPGFGG